MTYTNKQNNKLVLSWKLEEIRPTSILSSHCALLPFALQLEQFNKKKKNFYSYHKSVLFVMKSLLQTFSYFMFTYTCIFKGIISTVKLGFKSKDIWWKKPAITSTFSANPTTAKFLQGTFKKLKTCSFSIKLIQTRNIPSTFLQHSATSTEDYEMTPFRTSKPSCEVPSSGMLLSPLH